MTDSSTPGRRSGETTSTAAGLAPVTYLPGVLEAAARETAKAEAHAAEQEASHAAAQTAKLLLADAEATTRARADEAADDAHSGAARRAENVTLHAITRRGQSRAEVADLLRRREIDPTVAEAELDRLESVGLIDDRALAIDLADRLRTRKKLGPSALRSELMRRKLDRSAIDEALAGADDDGADDELVVELARDRARRLGGLDRTTAERRLIDYLARKGHSGNAAREAARHALDSRGDELSGSGHRVEFR